MTVRQAHVGPASVFDDWQTELAHSHCEVYNFYVPKLEAAYTVLSVSLDEAIGLHYGCRDQKASLRYFRFVCAFDRCIGRPAAVHVDSCPAFQCSAQYRSSELGKLPWRSRTTDGPQERAI